MATISDDIIRWNCDACTFSNPRSVDKCLICQSPQSMEALQFIKDLEQQRRQAQIKIQHQKQLEVCLFCYLFVILYDIIIILIDL